MKYIDAEEIEKRIHEIIDTNLNGVSPEINRRAAALFPVSCINDDGRPFDVNYTRREGFKKGLREAYENVLRIIDSLQQELPEVGLEKEIDAFFDKWDKNSNGGIFDENGAPVTIKTIKGVVKHFLNARNDMRKSGLSPTPMN